MRDVPITMRDGVCLRADVWFPDDGKRHPAILQRLPYDKSNSFITAYLFGLEPLRAAAAGYAVVVQDTRGCHGSAGRFLPFQQEGADGVDTIAWVTKQPFSDGRVCMNGSSYVGATQLLAAVEAPVALSAIAPGMTGSEYYDGWLYQGGVLQLGFALHWALGSLGAASLPRLRREGEDVSELVDEMERFNADPWPTYFRLPLADQPALARLCPSFFEWLAHPHRDRYWLGTAVSERYESIAVPALHIAGWSDIFLEGTIRNFRGIRAHARSSFARRSQRLIIGPWTHGNRHEVIGEVGFGAKASQMALDFTAKHLDFFGHALAGEEPPGPPVEVFVMGENAWRGEDDWPPERARVERLYLGSSGIANSSVDDGCLTAGAAAGAEPDGFLYDPSDPVPTVGGATLLRAAFLGVDAGPRDQRVVERRPDVLVYTGDVLTNDIVIAGIVRAVLSVASSAGDTDWTAKLVDVYPDGRALGILDGIQRAGARLDLAQPAPPAPYEVISLTVTLGSTCILVPAGHRLRLQISSSNFPRFARHPNSGDIPNEARAADLTVARQTVFHDDDRPSYLELPTIPHW